MNWRKMKILEKVEQLRKENDALVRQHEFVMLVISVLKEKGLWDNDSLKKHMNSLNEAKEKLRQEHLSSYKQYSETELEETRKQVSG